MLLLLTDLFEDDGEDKVVVIVEVMKLMKADKIIKVAILLLK